MDQSSDATLDFGEEDKPKTKKRIVHPIACFSHMVFRTLALAVYLFCGLTNAGFVWSFIVILLLLCADFWTVKNITGKKTQKQAM